VTRFFRTAGAVAGILTVPSTPDASAVVTMRLMIIPCLTGAGPTWCEPRILELAMLPAVLSLREERPRPGHGAHEHTSDYPNAHANIASMGIRG
jgi:hypothetical protein